MTLVNGISLHPALSLFDCLTHPGHEDIVQILEGQIPRWDGEWNHPPVDQIGPISLGRILVCDIGPASQNLLTGGRLLAGAAVPRFDRKDRAADPDDMAIDLREFLLDRLHDLMHFRKCLPGAGIRLNGLLRLLYLLGPADICRIPAREGELSQFQGIRPIRRRLPGGNELVCRRHRIMNLRYQLEDQILR